MPADGFTRMFENMLDHDEHPRRNRRRSSRPEAGPRCAAHDLHRADRRLFRPPLRRHCPIAACEFRHETIDQAQFQPVAVVNYPSQDVPYTRITEYKHLTGQAHAKTSISYEFAHADGEPYYPIPRPENQALFKRYEALALRAGRRDLCRPPRHLQILQHGPGGRAGARHLPAPGEGRNRSGWGVVHGGRIEMDAPGANPTIVLATDSLAPSGVGEHMLTLACALKHDHRIVLAFPDSGNERGLSGARSGRRLRSHTGGGRRHGPGHLASRNVGNRAACPCRRRVGRPRTGDSRMDGESADDSHRASALCAD